MNVKIIFAKFKFFPLPFRTHYTELSLYCANVEGLLESVQTNLERYIPQGWKLVHFSVSRTEIQSLTKDDIDAVLDKKIAPERVPTAVEFIYSDDCWAEPIREWCVMPSGDIVVRVDGGESFWFDADGNHPKSKIIWSTNATPE